MSIKATAAFGAGLLAGVSGLAVTAEAGQEYHGFRPPVERIEPRAPSYSFRPPVERIEPRVPLFRSERSFEGGGLRERFIPFAVPPRVFIVPVPAPVFVGPPAYYAPVAPDYNYDDQPGPPAVYAPLPPPPPVYYAPQAPYLVQPLSQNPARDACFAHQKEVSDYQQRTFGYTVPQPPC